jgi:hypothetical protein
MTDRLKLKQPKLSVVADSVPTDELTQTSPEAGNAGESSADDPNPISIEAPKARSGTLLPHSVDALQSLTQAQSQKHAQGLARHRMIVAGCISFSAVILALSCFDLSSLIRSFGTLDSSMHFKEGARPAQLPPNMHYWSPSSYWGPQQGASNLGEFSEGLAPVVVASWKGNLRGFVDESGLVAIKPAYEYVSEFNNGLAGVTLPRPDDPATEKSTRKKKETRWGFIDTKGKMVIEPQFSSVGMFDGVVAPVELADERGALINGLGEIVGPKLNSTPTLAGDLYIAEAKPAQVGLLDNKGHWVMPSDFSAIQKLPSTSGGSNYSRGLGFESATTRKVEYLRVCKDAQWGLADLSGKILIPPQFEKITDFHKGYASVRVDGKYGFAGVNGKMIRPRFEAVTPFDDLTAVRIDGKWHFMDTSGKLLSSPPVDGVILGEDTGRWLVNGLGAVIKDGRCGFVNLKGDFVVPPKYEWVNPYSEGYAAVWENDSWHYIDTSGKGISGNFASALPFSDGVAKVTRPGPLYRFAQATAIDRTKESIKETKERLTDPQYRRDRNDWD